MKTSFWYSLYIYFFNFQVTVTDTIVNPVPGPVMNSLVSDTKVVCNDSIPNPIAPVPIPIAVSDSQEKSITVLSGTIIKTDKDKNKIVNGGKPTEGPIEDKEVGKEETCMNTDTSTDLSNESSLSPSEPMDCNSTPNISPAHVIKPPENSTEDVAMSENSVFFFNKKKIICNIIVIYRHLVVVCRWKQMMVLIKW